MPQQRRMINPFYLPLAVVGAVFCVTAFAYALMVFRSVQPRAAAARVDTGHPLWQLLEARGNVLVLGELGAILGLTLAAIATDLWWTRGSARRGPLDTTGGPRGPAGIAGIDPETPTSVSLTAVPDPLPGSER